MAKTVYATGDIPTAANFNAFTQEANAAITGGTVNGAAIGGTTPAAGSFTTLGVGTASPGSTAHIKGAPTSAATGVLKIESTGVDYCGVGLYSRASGAGANTRNWEICTNYAADGNLDFVRSTAAGTSDPGTWAGAFSTTGFVSGGTIKGASTISVGNATPSASGSGITFPATQSASTDPNTLDDYEEGTWTPTVTYGTSNGDLSYTTQVGEYVKIGSVMHIFATLKFTESTASGVLRINLPVAVSALTGLTQGANCYADGLSGVAGGVQISITTNTTSANLYQGSTGTAVALTESNTGADSVFRFSFSYFV